jgi:protease-4
MSDQKEIPGYSEPSDGREPRFATIPDPSSGTPVGMPPWERAVLEKLALAALGEQRASRRWGIFFKSAFLLYAVLLLLWLFSVFGRTTEADLGQRHTALVNMQGVMESEGAASAEKINSALDTAFHDSGTAGVILRINSPGGSPVQAGMIHDEIKRLRAKYPEKPIYVVVEEICASGGYYAAVAADQIFVDKASIVGSIGVLMNGFGFTGAMEKFGVERRLLTAGRNKGIGDPFSPVSEEQKAYLQSTLDEIHQQFIAVVKEGRGKRLKDNPDLYTGLFWSGAKSIDLGLTDGFGTVESVARDVIKAEDVVDYTEKDSLAERFARRFGTAFAGSLASTILRSPEIR